MAVIEEDPPANFSTRWFDIKPFPCPTCEKKFMRKDYLQRHMQKPCKPKQSNRHQRDNLARATRRVVRVRGNDGLVHSIERDEKQQLRCPYRCDKTFTRQDHVKRHINSSCLQRQLEMAQITTDKACSKHAADED